MPSRRIVLDIRPVLRELDRIRKGHHPALETRYVQTFLLQNNRPDIIQTLRAVFYAKSVSGAGR